MPDNNDYNSHYSEKGFWEKVGKYAKVAGERVIYMALILYYAVEDRETPVWAKGVVLSALGYFILPADAIPDLIPAVGYADDLGVLSLARTCEELAPILRGWTAYYRKVETKESFEVLDEWIRRKLRVIYWRQWKRPKTRYRELVCRGIDPESARLSAGNGRGPWWNAGASHMNQAIPTRNLRRLGLMSLLEEHRRLQCLS